MRRVEERDESVKGVIEIGPDLSRCTKLRRTGAKKKKRRRKKKKSSRKVFGWGLSRVQEVAFWLAVSEGGERRAI